MGGKKPIKIIRLYDSKGDSFEACIGARVDPLLEVDYCYYLLTPKEDAETGGKRILQALSYYNPVAKNTLKQLPEKYFHIKVDNPQKLRYDSPRPDPPSIPEGDLPGWVPPSWIVYPKGNPLRPEHVETIEGISNLVSAFFMRKAYSW
jgi:hypothetical protein